MFRAILCSSSGWQIASLQHLVSSLSVNGRTVCRLRADCSPLSTGWIARRTVHTHRRFKIMLPNTDQPHEKYLWNTKSNFSQAQLSTSWWWIAHDPKHVGVIFNCLLKLTQRTRVGTLIVTTIYLQLIQNRYMFRSFNVLHCSHQHCVQPVASDVEVVGYL